MHKTTSPTKFGLLVLILLFVSSCTSNTKSAEPPADATAGVDVAAADEVTYPRSVTVTGRTVIVHPPQIRSWEKFEIIEGIAAIELVPQGDEAVRYGVVSFRANTQPDLTERTVALQNIELTSLTEDDTELPVESRELLAGAFRKAGVLPLDLVLSYLADDVLPQSTAGIKSETPKIFVSTSSAILMLFHGDPVWAPISNSDFQFAANTNWPLFKSQSGILYLNNDDTWLSANERNGTWQWAQELPPQLNNLPDNGNWKSSKEAAANWQGAPKFSVPGVLTSTSPAELILLVGEPQLVGIADTGIEYVENTQSQLLKFDNQWYYLVSGRWFTNSTLNNDWQPAGELPDAFAAIPDDHVKADLLAAVPNTPQAKMAVLDAQIPTKTAVPIGTDMPQEVSYAGDPDFVGIEGTEVKYARNTNYDILTFDGKYYLCYSGIWYVANSAVGPWAMAKSVPQQIYDIPPSAPVYHTTYVKVYDTTPTTVTYGYTSGYNNVYVYYGVPVYGSGWYYPPYHYYLGGYPIYYPYPYTYGSGSFYNPRSGAYGTVSRAYGPYGGWGYASGYNPRTGTYARAETSWDYDEWHLNGEAYNPRTGRYAETKRYYDADDNDWKTNTTLEGRRGDVNIKRDFDNNSGRLDVSNSRGGEGTFKRKASDGGWDTSGNYTTADGRTIESEGRYELGQGSSNLRGSEGGQGTISRDVGPGGVTREGSFSKDGKTLDTQTNRDGRNTRTEFNTSEGGKGVSTGRGAERTTLGKSASGDVYAAKDGSVYKRSDEGWSKRNGNDWSQIENRPIGESRTTRSGTSADRSAYQDRLNNANRQRDPSRASQNRQRNLNRDYSARQRGQARSRNFSSARGRFQGGGRSRGRRR